MSEGELFLLVLSLMLAFSGWGVWYATGVQVSPFGGHRARRLLFLTPVFNLVILLLVLRTLASADVREDATYLTLYALFGAAWTAIASLLFGWLGIHWRDDALERRNVAAALAICGAMTGVVLCFAGANVGDGPGWWVVFFCALVTTSTLFLVWLIHEKATSVAETITVDRDAAAGARLGAFLLSAGLILARAIAGDWESFDSTLRDFATLAWPVVILLVVAVVLERRLRPTAEHPSPDVIRAGAVPAFIYVALAAGCVFSWTERP
jgi:uncharacterized membrane protein YjfL (UPF0719 family)